MSEAASVVAHVYSSPDATLVKTWAPDVGTGELLGTVPPFPNWFSSLPHRGGNRTASDLV
jgi:hypothetical protein